MQQIAELSLPYLAVEDLKFAEDPIPHFNAARGEHPWLAKCAFGYVATEYAAIRDLMSMDDKMRGPYDFVFDLMNARGTRWARFQEESLMALWGDSHQRIRDVLAPMFTPRAANQRRGLMRQVISGMLDEWVPKGAFDFEEFVSYYPISVMCNLIGASPDIVPELRSSLEAIGLSMSLNPDFMPQLERAVVTMESYLAQLVAERRAGARLHEEHDLLDSLIEARDAGGLTDEEMTFFLIFLFVAGYDTSKNKLTMLMHELFGRPDIYSRCAEDLDYCQKVVEESFRFRSPGNAARMTFDDVIYREVHIPKNTMLLLPIGIAARDPSAVPNPDDFDPERPQQNRHLAFGRGMHMCLGQYIARAQIEEGFHLIAQRLQNPRLVGKVGARPFPGTWGLQGLPIEFTPSPLRAKATASSATGTAAA